MATDYDLELSAKGENSSERAFKPLKSIVSDAGIYAYCAICAVSLHDLFKEEYNNAFREQCLSRHVSHVGLPEQVKPVLYAFVNGEESCELETLIEVLKKEPGLNGNCLRIMEDLILFAVEGGVYDARMRVLILHIAWLLKVALPLVEIYEESVVDMLSNEVQTISEDEKRAIARRQRNKKIKRYLMVGIATLGGGAVLGLTGGLAAPFMAAGAGAIIGGAGAAALGSAAGIAVIGSLFGVAGAGLTGYKMQKRVGDIEEFAFDVLTDGQQLHITLAISGWLTDEGKDAFEEPWLTLMNSREQYCLRYESTYLLELGRAIDYLFSFAVTYAAQEALKYTILSVCQLFLDDSSQPISIGIDPIVSKIIYVERIKPIFEGLIAAITWPATLVTVAGVIDNPWGVCVRRSAEVGRHLANVLLERQQGKRPITLIGFSLGARVIFYCLQEMAKRKDCEGIVEDAILLGAPVPAHVKYWKEFAKVVNGRIVNGYCRGDWLLKFLYRTSSATMRIAGLEPIKWNDRRMCNIDLSSVVSGHMDYANKMDIILKAVGIRTIDEIIDGETQLRKSQSAMPSGRKVSFCHKRIHKSRSDGYLHLAHNASSPVIATVPRDRSLSLDSAYSALSPSSTSSVSPLHLSSFNRTPDSRLSPFTQQNIFSSFSTESDDADDTELVVPSNWDWKVSESSEESNK